MKENLAVIDAFLSSMIVAGLSGILLSLALVLLFRLRLAGRVERIGLQLEQIEQQLSEYRTFSKYLSRKDRTNTIEKLESVLGSIRSLSIFSPLLGKRQRGTVDHSGVKARECKVFLETFIPEYTKREVERHKDFFDGKSLDRDQVEAIVKKDTHNIVIASAGSGKTRTLTARIAFTVKCGVSPSKILALAYTNTAAEEMEDRLYTGHAIPDVNVKTFHSLARKLVMQYSSNFRTGVAKTKWQRKFVKDSVNRLVSEHGDFMKLLLSVAVELQTRETERGKFPSAEKYYEYLRNQLYTTLNGGTGQVSCGKRYCKFPILEQSEVRI